MLSRFQTLALEGLVNFKTGKLNSNAAKPDGRFPFFTCSQETFRTDTWSFDGEYVLLAGNNAAGIYPLKYFNGKFDAYQRTYAINSIDENVLVTRYVYYALRLQLELMKSISTGVATKFLTLSLLNRTQIPVPPSPTQRKIVAILSAYDDLIENNLRRIKILEEMAQNLYRQWFVKFRFPGHEKALFVDSPLGRIPQGWEVAKVGDILKKVKRGTKIQKQDYATEGSIPVVDQGKEFIGGYTDDIEALISYDLPLIVFGDHTRVLKFIDFPFACGADGTQLLKSDNERMPMTLFYYALLSIDLSDFAYARHFKFLKEESLVLPAKSIADHFDQFVSPLRDQMKSLMQKNTILRRTRDLLLPKLISGEVDVSELDITVPEEAA